MHQATWYFDFISPFAYLQLARFNEFDADLEITLKPVLFAGLLKHWGQLGPAEIAPKRRFVYRFFQWQAQRRGVPFVMPASHPFNPLPALRLAIAAGSDRASVQTIFRHIYGAGAQPDTEQFIASVAAELGIADSAIRLGDPAIKDALRNNTNEAINAGVFGVPTLIINDEVFWGDDASDMALEFARNPRLFQSGEMARLMSIPMGANRQ